MQQTFLKLKAAGSGMMFTGWASTNDRDRQGDIVEPAGAEYQLPVPLLWQHDHKQPVGAVQQAHISPTGIRVTGKLTDGVPKASEAWALMQDGALALSVGFQALESQPLPGGGLRFTKWSWHELSLVSVPANPQARLSIGKGMVLGSKPEAKAVPAPRPAVQAVGDVVTVQALELFGSAVGQAINEATRPLHERIKQLEAQKALHFAGDWQESLSYTPGAVVRHAGALHILNRETQPGHAPRAGSAWTRILKEH